MADRPIIMAPSMVRATLTEIRAPGTGKTNTRRVIRNVQRNNCITVKKPTKTKIGIETHVIDAPDYPQLLPVRVQKGDLLWVRENWQSCNQMDEIKPTEMSKYEPVRYPVDGMVRELSCMMVAEGRTRPSIHMPRWASRITLTVDDVSVERLQNITEDDAIAEGCRPYFDYENPRCVPGPNGFIHQMAPYKGTLDAFRELWDGLNAARGFGWDQNPWVMVIRFTPHLCNIDRLVT